MFTTQSRQSFNFHVGGNLPAGSPSYVERTADNQILQALLNQEVCYVCNCRQMGKSSLLVRTMHQLENSQFRCAAIDLTLLRGGKPPKWSWYSGLIREIHKELGLKKRVDINYWLKDRCNEAPPQLFKEYVEEILLQELTHENIILFFDEVDSVLSLPFKNDEFFDLIRWCYNRRAINSNYIRLNFALFGVIEPSILKSDKDGTPFNIGTLIQLEGIEYEKARHLAQGLYNASFPPELIVHEIIQWTGGQPFLTQKLCNLAQKEILASPTLNQDTAREWVSHLVHRKVVKDWPSHDFPEHFVSIQNRLLADELTRCKRLGVYQQILSGQEYSGNLEKEEQFTALLLAGVITKRGNTTKVFNSIYRTIFNQAWIDKELAQVRPYGEQVQQWIDSDEKDNDFLLKGELLEEATQWANDKRLDEIDYRFLAASRNKEADSILSSAKEESYLLIRQGKIRLSISTVVSIIVGFLSISAYISARSWEESAHSAYAELYSTIQEKTKSQMDSNYCRGRLEDYEKYFGPR